MRPIALAALLAVAWTGEATGQLLAARESPVTYGHHHVNASDVEAHERFWVDALGGRRVSVGTSSAVVVSFPNVLVFLSARAPRVEPRAPS